MPSEGLVVVLSLASAFAFALSSSLKHVSAGQAPDAQRMHPGKLVRFVMATLTHRLWLSGIGCDVVGLALQVLALHLGALAVVQPLLISGLLFALLLRQRFEHHHITPGQLRWALVLTAGLAGFVLLTSTGKPPAHEPVDRLPAVIAGALGIVVIVICVGLSRQEGRPGRSAALLGTTVGIIYAASAALLKAVTDIAARAPLQLLISWQLYTVVVIGAAGLLLNQLAFQAGPITASLPATAAIDPLLSIVIGVSVYDERIRGGAATAVALTSLLLLMGAAVFQLARSPEFTEKADSR